MEQFDPQINEIEIARLFRESFIAGNGLVNNDSILVVLNEQNFFVRTMQIKGRNMNPYVN